MCISESSSMKSVSKLIQKIHLSPVVMTAGDRSNYFPPNSIVIYKTNLRGVVNDTDSKWQNILYETIKITKFPIRTSVNISKFCWGNMPPDTNRVFEAFVAPSLIFGPCYGSGIPSVSAVPNY